MDTRSNLLIKLPEFISLTKEMRLRGQEAYDDAHKGGCHSVPVLESVKFEAQIQYWLDEEYEACERNMYTCIDKGGEYLLLGSTKAAGVLKGVIACELVSYLDTSTGQIYLREKEDFEKRMKKALT